MNTTGSYISKLLYRYECVIIPGFGALLSRRQPASIDHSAHTLMPPRKVISFNSQLQNNDGLLANYIADIESISYTDAVAKIQRYVLSLEDKMKQGDKVMIEGIGSFYLGAENTLQFESSDQVNYLTETFGCSILAAPEITREITREVYKEEVEALEETTPIAFTPEKRANRSYLKYAAAAVIAIAIASPLVLNQLGATQQRVEQKLALETTKAVENKIQEATFEIANPLPAINLTVVKEQLAEAVDAVTDDTYETKDYRFHIVAGAYRVAENAEKQVQELKDKGFPAYIIGVNKYGLHQVAFSGYTSRTEAVTALRKLKNEETKSAWMLIQ